MLRRLRLSLRTLLMRRRLEREMHEEMTSHLDRATARLVSRGLPEQEARHAALREFGNVSWLQEQARDARGGGWIDALRADLRFALRHFARTPWTTLTMLLVLILGMSIATLLFTYVHAYATMPPPGVTFADDLVRIRGSRNAGPGSSIRDEDARGYRTFPEEELLEYQALTGHFDAVAGWTDATVTIGTLGDDRRRGLPARVTFATENYFSVLDVRPMLGPGLPEAADPSRITVAVIGHIAWLELFGGNPEAIGSTLIVNGIPVTVIGVAPEKFVGFPGFIRFQLWMPLAARPVVVPETMGEFRAIARLRDGVGLRAATAAVGAVAARTGETSEELRELDPSADVVPLLSANSDPMFDRDVRLMTLSVGLLGLLVLLVTCTNVSALLTGLATARRQEIAVRLSVGAARTRLVRQLLTESALLASFAAAAALGVVWMVIRVATRVIPGLPFDVGIGWTITAFTFGVALAVGVAFGLSPALHATRLGLAGALRDSTATIAATRGRLQRGLVTAQIAFTQPLIVLLAGVLLLVLGSNHPQPRTAHADRLVTVRLSPSTPITWSTSAAADSRRQLLTALQRLRDRLESTPGVEAAVMEWGVTIAGSYLVHPDDRVPGVTDDVVPLVGNVAADGWFDAMGIRLLRGREFEAGETGLLTRGGREIPVILGHDLVRRLWGAVDPIGRRLRPAEDTTGWTPRLVVVGVIEDPAAETRKPGEDYRVWLPPDTTMAPRAVLVRTASIASTLIPTIRELAIESAPDMAARIRTIAEAEEETRRRFRLVTGSLAAAGVIALVLSAIGLYAVVAFSVGQRTREIAVRMAVGARGWQIVRRFVADGLRLSAIGLAIGLPAGLLGLHGLVAFIDATHVAMPRVAAIATLGVLLVAAAATWIPARRAALVDPAVTLRSE